MVSNLSACTLLATAGALAEGACSSKLRVETRINTGLSVDMVSSLIIGSQAAVLIDMPMAVPQAKTLADWVRNTTDKPLIAAFTTHFHPDHYLSGSELLSQFPEAKYYANSKAAAQINIEAEKKARIQKMGAIFGVDNIAKKPLIPTPYDFTFFALPGDEDAPIHLLSPLNGDTVDETLFWIPSIRTLIAGDSVYGHDMHIWLADLATPQLTEAWLSTLDFIQHLSPKLIIPGHSLSNTKFGPSVDLEHTRKYLHFWQKIEAKGPDHFTPQEIVQEFNKTFPSLLEGENVGTSTFLLNATAEEFGRGGRRQDHFIDLTAFNNTADLDAWKFSH